VNIFKLNKFLLFSSPILSIISIMWEDLTVFTRASLGSTISSACSKVQKPFTQVHDPQTSVIGFTCPSLKGLKYLATFHEDKLFVCFLKQIVQRCPNSFSLFNWDQQDVGQVLRASKGPLLQTYFVIQTAKARVAHHPELTMKPQIRQRLFPPPPPSLWGFPARGSLNRQAPEERPRSTTCWHLSGKAGLL